MGHDVLDCENCGSLVMESRNSWECDSCGYKCSSSTEWECVSNSSKVTNKVEYALREYADFPYAFNLGGDKSIPWLTDNIKNGNIKAEFRSEDYWYLRVRSADGHEVLVGPGDYICYDEEYGVYAEVVTT